MRLYREKGFEGVTVAEIAREAEAAPRTFFGYFETKEDVFLGRGDDRLDRIVRAIHDRARRPPVLSALRPALRQERESPLADRAARPGAPEPPSPPSTTRRL